MKGVQLLVKSINYVAEPYKILKYKRGIWMYAMIIWALNVIIWTSNNIDVETGHRLIQL